MSVRVLVACGVVAAGLGGCASQPEWMSASDAPLDLCLNGPGFFKVADETGFAYSRIGRFTLNADGEIVLATQRLERLEPRIVIPVETTSVSIDSKGAVACWPAGSKSYTVVGRIVVSTFASPEQLLKDNGLFRATVESGPAIEMKLGTETTVLQYVYERSNPA